MSFFGELARSLSMLFRRSQFDAELEEEMRLHLELREQQQQLQTGMTQPAARSALAAGFEIPQCSRRKPQDLEMPPKLPPSEPYYAPSCTSRKSTFPLRRLTIPDNRLFPGDNDSTDSLWFCLRSHPEARAIEPSLLSLPKHPFRTGSQLIECSSVHPSLIFRWQGALLIIARKSKPPIELASC
jgi:hypothetical protein